MSNNQNSSCFKLYKCRYAFQLIKFSVFNYYFMIVDTLLYTCQSPPDFELMNIHFYL